MAWYRLWARLSRGGRCEEGHTGSWLGRVDKDPNLCVRVAGWGGVCDRTRIRSNLAYSLQTVTSYATICRLPTLPLAESPHSDIPTPEHQCQ